MKRSEFFYNLPKELIAQTPIEPRDSSRMLVMHKATGELEHKIFRDVTDYLKPGKYSGAGWVFGLGEKKGDCIPFGSVLY